jgi:phosphatidylserine decarboxylase
MFWLALARTCDADNSNTMSRLEVQTMLETLGSNISEHTLDQFWQENGKELTQDLTMDELVKSLEAFMQMSDETAEDPNLIIEQTDDVPVDTHAKSKDPFFLGSDEDDILDDDLDEDDFDDYYFTSPGEYDEVSESPSPDEADYEVLAEGDGVQYVDGALKKLDMPAPLSTSTTSTTASSTPSPDEANHHQEKVIRITQCPICRRKNLGKRGQMDIVTHVATCAANDWTTVDRFLMGNFGSEAQAQRK